MKIRSMTIEDYEKVYELWMSCIGMGFTAELGEAIAANLRTEKPMNRMIGYLFRIWLPGNGAGVTRA